MQLIRALANTPLRWTLTTGEVPSKRTGKPIPRLLLTVIRQPDAERVVMDFPKDAGTAPEALLAAWLVEHDPSNALLQQWYAFRGQTPVELEKYAMDSLGEAMHTALRKLADSKQSVITWNALHHVHPDDRAKVWDTARDVLTEAFEAGTPVIRRALAATLRDRIIGALNGSARDSVTDRNGKPEDRTDAQAFALRMLIAGCEMTALEEWMWGWLGYVVKDAQPAPVA